MYPKSPPEICISIYIYIIILNRLMKFTGVTAPKSGGAA